MLHREDIKAAIRKEYGSLLAFEQALGLPVNSVTDVLRGRAVAQTRRAIAELLKMPPDKLFTFKRRPRSSIKADDNAGDATAHRLNQEAA